MPEYLAPGVYVEETSFRSKSIEGVSTTTTGFVGPTRCGPIGPVPEIVTSLAAFERLYGDGNRLQFTGMENGRLVPLEPMHNYIWHGARAYFEEGGKRLYISRIFRPIDNDTDDGCARAWLPDKPSNKASAIQFRARFPGEPGNGSVRLTLRLGQNILGQLPVPGQPSRFTTTVKSLVDGDLVRISEVSAPQTNPPVVVSEAFYIAKSFKDPATGSISWRFEGGYSPGGNTNPTTSRTLGSLVCDTDPTRSDKVQILTLSLSVLATGKSTLAPAIFEGLPLHPGHEYGGEPDSLFDRFAAEPVDIRASRHLPIVIERGEGISDGIKFLKLLFAQKTTLRAALDTPGSTDQERSIELNLAGGNDGQCPGSAEYEGAINPTNGKRTGLKVFEDLEDISIVAAPGATYGYLKNPDDGGSTVNALITHATKMRYRIAVLDSGDGQSIAEVRAMRGKLDSSYAALYYPWIRVLDPVTRAEISLPPSGFVAGIYVRNDTNRAVFKAPANEVVTLAVGFETLINKSQQEVLNPEGINCFRHFEGRGFRLWGARTVSSDPEWKYVNLRRYFAYLEHSIDKGTLWAVFEPNGEMLWANVRRTIEDFMLNEWQSGALLGDKPDKAYFVRCDRSTMTQNDLDNGRLVCLVGVAALRPAEFVIFRIGQWTADRKM